MKHVDLFNNSKIFDTGICWILLTLVILMLDISSKYFITHFLFFGESIYILSFINFIYTCNSGSAFNFLSNEVGYQRWVFSAIAICTSTLLLIMMYNLKKQDVIYNISYAMIIGGSIGNLFDRIVYSVVIDFIDFHIGSWHLPTFNIADSSICIGALIILIIL